jgi:hypothetical protein
MELRIKGFCNFLVFSIIGILAEKKERKTERERERERNIVDSVQEAFCITQRNSSKENVISGQNQDY